MRRPQNFAKPPPIIWLVEHRTNNWWRFRKILWPSQNILTSNLLFFSMSFYSKWAWSPPDNATSLDFPSAKSLVSELSVEVSFFFCASNGSVRILKKARDFFFKMMPCIFLITVSFERNIFSSLFLLNCGLFSSQKIVSLLDIFFWYR